MFKRKQQPTLRVKDVEPFVGNVVKLTGDDNMTAWGKLVEVSETAVVMDKRFIAMVETGQQPTNRKGEPVGSPPRKLVWYRQPGKKTILLSKFYAIEDDEVPKEMKGSWAIDTSIDSLPESADDKEVEA